MHLRLLDFAKKDLIIWDLVVYEGFGTKRDPIAWNLVIHEGFGSHL